ncbi:MULTISPECIES: 50S ribosomal protein L6 [Hymenobacter]|uniref:Large ribosomal subunit protein uL6 n=5 Tax=Hymenobacter TaxID=89966 RepID=A0A8T9Q4I8_9BACT|nr:MULTISPECIES: 50S ribosomal protein L6 [Hymenobacter]MCB2376178.1 50S ribosomal protein L6 [Hymenobacter nitidus]PJJ54674.1 large subunit ribosomal protein L6 [Hymenobacter chitinivorans DSM 11115]TGE27139.1 50S ribosomal protein L6 [Hymenobacter metallicola]UOQ53339.1 50S ribosomal protein L6 [Hymenobacter cellulosivorans]UOQ72494.1 50S ribosomal protein L6 [Hymenobacter cellulosilyticus]
MSRIGKLPISLPSGVQVEVSNENTVTVKGPKGTLTTPVDRDITLTQADGQLVVERPTEQKRHKAMHGLYRSLINNMVNGVSNGFELKLELVGVGYKAAMAGTTLELSLGYSHNIFLALPKEVTATAVTEKGKNPIVTLNSIDNQLLGQVAAKIRSLRKVEPYKGKGVRFVGEQIRRKAGKTASK